MSLIIDFYNPPEGNIGNLIYNHLIGERLAKLYSEKGISFEIGLEWVMKNLKSINKKIISKSFQSEIKYLNTKNYESVFSS